MCRESSTSQHFLLHKPLFTYLTSSLVNSTFPHLIPDKQLWLSYSMPHILWIFLIDVMAEIFHFLHLFNHTLSLLHSAPLVNWFSTSAHLSTSCIIITTCPLLSACRTSVSGGL